MRLPFLVTIISVIAVVGVADRAVGQLPGQSPVAPAVDSVKLRLIREVLKQSHAMDMVVQGMEAGATAQRAANPQIPAEFWDRFLAEVRQRTGELEALFIPIYDRHFTAGELRQLIAFYGSPIGQKMVTEQPAIAREAMESGRQWGHRLGVAVGQKMAAEAQKAP